MNIAAGTRETMIPDIQGSIIGTLDSGSGALAKSGHMDRIDACSMIRRRTAEAGFQLKLGCHVFRATGITAYLETGGTLEKAQAMAAHDQALRSPGR